MRYVIKKPKLRNLVNSVHLLLLIADALCYLYEDYGSNIDKSDIHSDTDSLHMLGEYYHKLFQLGYIKKKSESKLGYLCSDIADEGLIISEINNGPKCYTYDYINIKNDVIAKEDAIKKCKGIPKKELRYEMYVNDAPTPVSFEGLRKKHIRLNKKDKEIGLLHSVSLTHILTELLEKQSGQVWLIKIIVFIHLVISMSNSEIEKLIKETYYSPDEGFVGIAIKSQRKIKGNQALLFHFIHCMNSKLI